MASALLRPSTTPTQRDQAEADPVDDQGEAEQGAGPSETKPTRTRTRRAAVGGETRGRKLSIPDSVFDRLQLTAIQRKKTISAVAAEILDRNLPRLRIERD